MNILQKFKQHHSFYITLVATLVVIIDQVTKGYIYIRAFLTEDDIIIFPFLQLTLVLNTGVSFSLLNFTNYLLLSLLSFCATIIVVLFVLKSFDYHRRSIKIAIALIIGGSLGNILDRVRLGAVIDFISVNIKSYHFPIFNIADIAINLAVILLLYDIIIRKLYGLKGK